MKGEKEEWRQIPGYDGAYDVSSIGRVRSWMNGRFGRRIEPVLRRQFIGSNGYPEVGLRLEGKKTNRLVHELVLLAFVGERPHGLVACHENDRSADNRLVNLRWGTRSENYRAGLRNGGAVLNGPRSLAKLSCKDVEDIKALLNQGSSNRNIARTFGVSHSRISAIRNGKAHKKGFAMESAS